MDLSYFTQFQVADKLGESLNSSSKSCRETDGRNFGRTSVLHCVCGAPAKLPMKKRLALGRPPRRRTKLRQSALRSGQEHECLSQQLDVYRGYQLSTRMDNLSCVRATTTTHYCAVKVMENVTVPGLVVFCRDISNTPPLMATANVRQDDALVIETSSGMSSARTH